MLKLGIVQMSVQEGGIDENCKKLRQLVKSHSEDDIDLLCFPELCISGYDFARVTLSNAEAGFFSELASAYGIGILAGIHRKEREKHYDSVCLWDEQGKMLGEYHKIHLWESENGFFDEGGELVTVPFKGWNIGILICADYGFPEISTILAQEKDAEVIIYPSAWAAGWEDLLFTCTKIRAAENQVYTVAPNRASGDLQYCGNTTVSNPDGSTLLRLETSDEAYGRVVLEKEKLEAARKALPWRKMKRCDIYSKL